MIKSHGDQGTQDLHNRKDTKAARRCLHPKFWKRAYRALDELHSVASLSQLRALRQLRLHKLRGNLKGWYAIDFGYQERIVFRYDEASNSATDVFVSNDHYGD